MTYLSTSTPGCPGLGSSQILCSGRGTAACGTFSLSSKYSLTELEFLRVLAQAPVRQSNKTLFGKSADGGETSREWLAFGGSKWKDCS